MRFVSAALSVILCFSVIASSCSKEKSFEVEAPATGSLQSDATGDCLPKTAVGAFVAGTAVTDSNYLLVDVDVTTLGSYAIRTDTANGYSFSGMGNFEKTGINQVRLQASGTPTAAGTDEFAVLFDSSFCFMSVTVLPAGSSGAASFTLQGSGDSCILASAVSGTYTQNQALTNANKVDIKVNTTTAGTYTLTTNSANGFSFSGSGTLASAGEHTITLTASGLPTAAGSTVFSLSAGSTTCSFSVTVVASSTPPPPPTTTGLLFPLTANSWWSYVQDEGDADSIEVVNAATQLYNQKEYRRFDYKLSGDVADQAYFRKEGDNYYEYADVTKYSLLEFDTAQQGDILFLKENLTPNTTWKSAEFTGTANGTAITMYYEFTCTAVNATEPINGVSIPGITKISMTSKAGFGGVFADVGAHFTLYFAKGIGLVYQEAKEFSDATLHLKNYKVN